ncbi:unnamed protein product [Heterobilharzia americana]|nr:unnamed protein product [Heterobilharzia americana]
MQSRSYKDDCVIFDDDFPGYSVNTFSLADKYQKYIESIIVPNGMIKDRIDKMAFNILKTFKSNGICSINMLCVLKGGFKFASDLSEKLHSIAVAQNINIPIFMDFIVASTYINDNVGHETRLHSYTDLSSYRDKNILIIEDLVDSGTTLERLLSHVQSSKPRSVHVACLLVKRRSDCSQFPVDFVGFEIPNRFIVGYAIDYNDFFRDIPHICSINNEAKKLFAVSNESTEK